MRFRARANVGDDFAHVAFELAIDEHTLRMGSGEFASARRRACLVQHRSSLRRWFGEMDRVHLVVTAGVPNPMDARRISEHSGFAITQYGAVFPTAFPELVDDLHIFLGHVVTAVVFRLLRHSHAAGGAVEIAGDDVPADAPLGQVIERRHAACERIGRFVSQIAGDAEAKILRGVGHRGDQQQRIVDRDLDGVADRGVRRALEYVVDAEDVGEEQTVEEPTFQGARKFYPVVEIGVVHRAVARVRPHSVLNVADAIHVEGIEADLLRHVITLSLRGREISPRADSGHGNSPRVFFALRTFSTPIAIAAVRCETLSCSTRFITWPKARSSTW